MQRHNLLKGLTPIAQLLSLRHIRTGLCEQVQTHFTVESGGNNAYHTTHDSQF